MGHESRAGVKDGNMIRSMCGVSLKERQPTIELRKHIGVEAIRDVMRQTGDMYKERMTTIM